MINAAQMIIAMIFALESIYLVNQNNGYWGWFVIAALIAATSVKKKSI